MHIIQFPMRLHPRPAGGAYSAPPNPLAVFKGPTSKGRAEEEGGNGKEKGREEEGEVRGREGKEGEGPAPKYFGLEPHLVDSRLRPRSGAAPLVRFEYTPRCLIRGSVLLWRRCDT